METLTILTAVFIASLFGSLHCVGMCGPLAVMASSATTNRSSRLSAILAYHGGRVVSYATLGLIAGLIGIGLQNTGALVGIQRAAARLAGGTMLIVGLVSLIHLLGGQQHRVLLPKRLQGWMHQGHIWARKQPPMKRAAVVGVLTSLLPCGWLYAFLLAAASTASAWQGALVMATFALGAVPALAVVSLGTDTIFKRFGKAIPIMSAVLVTAIGAYTLTRRASLDVVAQGPSKAGLPFELQIRQAAETVPPCCQDKKS